jgi:signal transduction histidine kinase
MSVADINQAVSTSAKDEALARHFLVVWPVINSILHAFSNASKLPIFAYLNGHQVFRSSADAMPHFCGRMLGSALTESLCVEDGARRASKQEPEVESDVQMCHAGFLNWRHEIETGVGNLTILFGARTSGSPEAARRRAEVVSRAGAQDTAQGELLAEAARSIAAPERLADDDITLLDAISEILRRLLSATVGFRTQTINMAHELTLMMVSLGLWIDEMNHTLRDFQATPGRASLLAEVMESQRLAQAQCRLGLYIVRNFLSHASETRYSEVVRAHYEQVNVRKIVLEMIDLHRPQASQKKIDFDASGLTELPPVYGSDMELRRLFHNVLNNAIKYSYHSVPNARRIIRVRSKVPYDPGFRRRRFSVSVENFGLGLTRDELRDVFRPGFRGKQAVAEVPIGSGIGLSEALKIMKAHHGEIKLSSKELYEDEQGMPTYLTTVDVIFPYGPRGGE